MHKQNQMMIFASSLILMSCATQPQQHQIAGQPAVQVETSAASARFKNSIQDIQNSLRTNQRKPVNVAAMPPQNVTSVPDPDASKLIALSAKLSLMSAPDGRRTQLFLNMPQTGGSVAQAMLGLDGSVPEGSYIASIPLPTKGIENLPIKQLEALTRQVLAFASTMDRRPTLVFAGPKAARDRLWKTTFHLRYYGVQEVAEADELCLVIYLEPQKREEHQ